jgi:hypothetical protein
VGVGGGDLDRLWVWGVMGGGGRDRQLVLVAECGEFVNALRFSFANNDRSSALLPHRQSHLGDSEPSATLCLNQGHEDDETRRSIVPF